MANETKQKKYEIVVNFDVNEDVVKDSFNKRRPFLMKYWLEEVEYKNEKKSRFKFLPDYSTLRLRYEEVLNSNDISNSYVRFDDHHAYVMLIDKNSRG